MSALKRHVAFTPGSEAAIAKGCICPVLDNAHGRGTYASEAGGPLFWMADGCPVHDDPAPIPPTPPAQEER